MDNGTCLGIKNNYAKDMKAYILGPGLHHKPTLITCKDFSCGLWGKKEKNDG